MVRYTTRLWRRLTTLLASSVMIALIAAAIPALAQPAADAGQRWEQLNAQVEQAYQTGDYARGSQLAEQAYELARQAFGERDPRTLTSLNNLGLLYHAKAATGRPSRF